MQYTGLIKNNLKINSLLCSMTCQSELKLLTCINQSNHQTLLFVLAWLIMFCNIEICIM